MTSFSSTTMLTLLQGQYRKSESVGNGTCGCHNFVTPEPTKMRLRNYVTFHKNRSEKDSAEIWRNVYPLNFLFLGSTGVLNPNSISIGSAVFAGLTTVTDRQTDRQTTLLGTRPHIGTYVVMRCGLIIGLTFIISVHFVLCYLFYVLPFRVINDDDDDDDDVRLVASPWNLELQRMRIRLVRSPCVSFARLSASINTVRKQSDGVERRSHRAPTRSDGIERTNGLAWSVPPFSINVSTPEVCNRFQSHPYVRRKRSSWQKYNTL